MEKIDARKLTPDGRKVLRQTVIRLRQQTGMKVDDLAAIAGVHPTTIKTWLARAKREGIGALGDKCRGRPIGSCRKLKMADEMWIRDQVISQNPQQLSLPFALWTRPAIKALIWGYLGIELQDRLMGKYLKRWGFTPQRPVKRALEQRPEDIEKWLTDTYPGVKAHAKAEGAVIFWGDETAVKEDANWVRGCAHRGKAPILAMPTRWHQLTIIFATSLRGEIAFQIVEGSINADLFIVFLTRLLEGVTRKVFLVTDNLRAHHTRVLTEWLSDKQDHIELVLLPPYAP